MGKRGALWSTDFDGTLYSGPRGRATISTSVVSRIGAWLRSDGWFHVLSGGSMAGMVRDGFDLVADIVEYLDRTSESDVEQLVRERVTFSMSNGAEHYRIRNPREKIGRTQCALDERLSVTIAKREALAFAEFVERRFGLSVLAMDAPLCSSEDNVVALFLARNTQRGGCGAQFVNEVNTVLDAMGSPLQITFVREEMRDGLVRQRFDAFPGRIAQYGKLDTAQRVFSKHESVVFTGDQPLGNDRLVFEWIENQPEMEGVFVENPADLAAVVIP